MCACFLFYESEKAREIPAGWVRSVNRFDVRLHAAFRELLTNRVEDPLFGGPPGRAPGSLPIHGRAQEGWGRELENDFIHHYPPDQNRPN